MKNNKQLSIIFGLILFYSTGFGQCPIINSCTPGNASNSQAALFGGGILQVKLGTTFTNTTPGAADGYKDYCTLGPINFTLGSPLAVNIKTGNTFNENLRIFIDINNDQIFSATNELFFSSNNTKTHVGSILINSGTTGQQLKMRITSDLITASVVPGPCTTPEFSQVEDYAIVLLENTNPPIARFSVSDSITCNGTINFNDNSSNNPTGWFWDFGDGQNSIVQNPSHTYSASGFYTVKLRVNNANGVDSLVKPNFIKYNDTIPVAAVCQPITFNQCCGYGISSVIFNTINNPSSLGSYQNFTCNKKTTLLKGRNYPIQISTNPNQNQDTRVWIDYNSNGIFETNELVFQSLSSRSPIGNILISSDTSVKINKGLRMRVMSEFTGGAFGPCTDLDKGQCEDYTVIIKNNTEPPVASFEISSSNFCQPTFDFKSTSINSVLIYHWFFGDGKDTVVTTPTISYSYATRGTYDVKLLVIGPFGNDSITKTNAVNYYGAPPTNCSLNTQAGGPALGTGIAEVEFGAIKLRTGNSSEGYQNYSCLQQATVKVGQSVRLTVRNSSQEVEKVQAWIDWNGNGQFETTERVMNSQADTVHSILVPVPQTAITGTTVRLRVASNLQQANQFGSCGTLQIGQAEDYGVIILINNVKPDAAFTVNSRTTCTGSVQFSDSSQNIPSSYTWEFGDGETSTDANPSHTYAAIGTYSIKLIATNAFGSDTIEKPNYITVTAVTGMALSNCIPPSNATCCQYGIQQVTFAGINQISEAATEGNRDFTCTTIGSAIVGTQQPISIINSGQNPENVEVWMDWNNDGLFAENESVFSSNGNTSHSGNITIPSNAPAGLGIRMRVKSDFSNQPLSGPCEANQFGQFEDYQIKFLGNDEKPDVRFAANNTISCNGTISFQDTSFNAPTQWKWFFGDGDSSTLRNPTHSYSVLGTFDVTLIASNQNGSDTLVKAGYITIADGGNLKAAPCTPQTINLINNQGVGISNVTFNTISRPSPTAPTESYVDASCQFKTSVIQGNSYQLTVNTGSNFPESCRAWIDWNNNGQFEDPAERVLNGQNSTTHTAAVAVPISARIDTVLRMRIISDFGGGGPGGNNIQPCNNPNFGQCEDYGVKVIQNTTPPIAKISSLSASSCNGFIQFRDSSRFVPTSWFWEFGDGQNSTLKNPGHTYSTTGNYNIKLKVINSFGVDSVTIPNYVNITATSGPKPPACVNVVTTPSANFGITRVRMANLDKTTGLSLADGGSKDFTCSDSILIAVTAPGQQNQLIINTSSGANRENCRVFIDFNNNGIFDNNESVFSSQNTNQHTVNLIFTQAQAIGVPVRMRIISDVRFNQINSACYNPQQGQVEDYSIKIVWLVPNQVLLTNENFKIYPNPTEGKLTFSGSEEIKDLFVTDIQGKIVSNSFTKENLAKKEFDLTYLSNGVYHLHILTEKGPEKKQIIISK